MTLRELRKAKCLTQQDLSARAGISQCYICALEQGRKKSPSIATIRKLAEGLGVNASCVLAALDDEAIMQ